MIALKTLDDTLAQLDDEASVETAMVAFARQQTPFLQYLRTDGFDLLTDDERDYLLYLALVVYRAFAAESPEAEPPVVSGEDLESLDERAWTWMEAGANQPLHKRLDAFFDNVDQEELLAFAEDSLIDPDRDDDSDTGAALFTSAASRELGLVGLCVLIMGLDGAF